MPVRGRVTARMLSLFDPDAFGDPPRNEPPAAPSGDGPPAAPPRPPAANPVAGAGSPATGRRLTAAQDAAAEQRSCSLLLSASAGSGKTSVLVARFVRAVLDDGLDPGRILAITFTDKAAGELRERIRATLHDLGTPAARAAARATEGAFVSTIHGFCARLLRAHPLAAGLDPSFAVLDEPRAARLRDESFAAALRAFLGGPHAGEALDLVAAYRTDALAFAIPVIHDELRSRGVSHPRLPVPPRRPAPAAERTALAAARTALAVELESARDSKLVDDARAALDRCARFLEDVEAGIVPWPGRLAALDIACGRAAALDTEACHAYVEARDAYERACADHHAVRHVELLDELLDAYAAAYAEGKTARGALDFDDLELRARDLLRERPAIRTAWRERFTLLMVDEFQDTNRRQLEILEALEDDTLFSVGDEFQSIYGFRHADVAIFRERRDTLTERGLALRLQESFRSAPAILAAVNTAFMGRFGEAFAPLRPFAEPAAADAPGSGGAGRASLRRRRRRPSSCSSPTPAGGTRTGSISATRCRPGRRGGGPRPGCSPSACASSSTPARRPRATSRCSCVPRPPCRSLSARWPTPACRPWPARGAASGPGRRSWTCWATRGARQPARRAGAAHGARVAAVRAVVGRDRPAGPRRTRPGTSLWAVLGARPDPDAAGREVPPAGVEAVPDLLPADASPVVRAPRLPAGDAAALAAFLDRFGAQRAAAPRRALDEVLDRAVAEAGYDAWAVGLVGGARRLANIDKPLRLAREFEAAEGATCAASSTTPPRSSRPRSASPRRRSKIPASTRSGS
ncbi:MAG: UvrD-helicase domain-containing protein [Solirubrobacterales bacterium]